MAKNVKKSLLHILVMLVVAMILPACSDKKEGEPADPTTHDQQLIGSWKSVWEVFNGMEEYSTLTFRRDGRFESFDQWINEDDSKVESAIVKGEWETDDNNNLVFYVTYCPDDKEYEGETERVRYSIVDDDHIIIDGETYTRE